MLSTYSPNDCVLSLGNCLVSPFNKGLKSRELLFICIYTKHASKVLTSWMKKLKADDDWGISSTYTTVGRGTSTSWHGLVFKKQKKGIYCLVLSPFISAIRQG